MKCAVFLCWLLCSGLFAKSQGLSELTYIDSKASSIPNALTYSSDSIAAYIQSNFKTDPEKLRAAYAWVITNIRYDRDSMYPINWSMEHEEKIAATLRRKRGVCENYAALFTDIAVKTGFQSFVVSGYTRIDGAMNRSGHSWCAVLLKNEWFLCDPTWDSDSRGNTRYYLVPPYEFIENHIPFDPLWQLLQYPLLEHEFSRGIFRAKKDKQAFDFADSAQVFLQLDSLQQLEAATRRIKAAGIENEKQRVWVAYNQMKIAGIYGEKDMELYNGAVADLNKANVIFNSYVKYRNDRFIPARPDDEINGLLEPIARLVASASKKLEQVGQGSENFQYDTGGIKDRLTALSVRVQEQQRFVKNYLANNAVDREKLFYK